MVSVILLRGVFGLGFLSRSRHLLDCLMLFKGLPASQLPVSLQHERHNPVRVPANNWLHWSMLTSCKSSLVAFLGVSSSTLWTLNNGNILCASAWVFFLYFLIVIIANVE